MKDHFGSTYEIDTTVARSPRVYDYLLGGSNNFAVDREAAERSFACLPGGVEAAGAMARANRTFQARAIREVVSNAAVRQVLSIDTGIPYADNVHEVAQRTVPETRVVFVDSDPIVLAHAHALQRSTPEGAAAYVQGDLRDPETILRTAAKTLDLTEPVAVTLTMILHLLPDEANPYGIVDQLMGAVPPGSYLVISHLADDIQPEALAEAVDGLNQALETPWTPRSRAAVTRFFRGLEVVDPGIVPIDRWQASAPPAICCPSWLNPVYVGIGRKSHAAPCRCPSRDRPQASATDAGLEPPAPSSSTAAHALGAGTGSSAERPGDERPGSRWHVRGAALLAGAGALVQALPSLLSGPLAWLVTCLATVRAIGLALVQTDNRSRRRSRARLRSSTEAEPVGAGSRRAATSQTGQANLQINNPRGSVNINVGPSWPGVLAGVLIAIVAVAVAVVIALTVASTDSGAETPASSAGLQAGHNLTCCP